MSTGCGFHLRGMMDMPSWLSELGISVQKVHRDLGPELRQSLEAYAIHIKEPADQAQYLLILEQDFEEKRIISVSSSTTPRQFELRYTVQFSLESANGKIIIPSSRVTSTRVISVNSDRILGSNYEESLLKEEMRRDAVLEILERLRHAKP